MSGTTGATGMDQNTQESASAEKFTGHLLSRRIDDLSKQLDEKIKLPFFRRNWFIAFCIIGLFYAFGPSISLSDDGDSGKKSKFPFKFGLIDEDSHKFDFVSDPGVRFEDVKGADEVLDELDLLVDFLKNPSKYKSLGAKMPKGLLLEGPPGTGKTLIARALAGEANIPFISACGAEFDEVFVGVGARRIRSLFDTARENAPVIVFIDELDTIGSKRSTSDVHPHARDTINQLLKEMDGFDQYDGIIVVGATNMKNVLDPALLRSGRFDLTISMPTPDITGRKEIIDLYLSQVPIEPGLTSDKLSKLTAGLVGADLKNIINQACMHAAMEERREITSSDLLTSFDKVTMGPQKKSLRLSDFEKEITAWHEVGHALVCYFTPHSHPLNKVTILPRGNSLGHTQFLVEKENSYSKSQMFASMDVSMGGRIAEELKYGKNYVTSGASQDLTTATSIARNVVRLWGMNDKLGPISINKSSSPETEDMIEAETRLILKESYERAKTLLQRHSKEHEIIVREILIHETLDYDEVKQLIETGRLPALKKTTEKVRLRKSNPRNKPESTGPRQTRLS